MSGGLFAGSGLLQRLRPVPVTVADLPYEATSPLAGEVGRDGTSAIAWNANPPDAPACVRCNTPLALPAGSDPAGADPATAARPATGWTTCMCPS